MILYLGAVIDFLSTRKCQIILWQTRRSRSSVASITVDIDVIESPEKVQKCQQRVLTFVLGR